MEIAQYKKTVIRNASKHMFEHQKEDQTKMRYLYEKLAPNVKAYIYEKSRFVIVEDKNTGTIHSCHPKSEPGESGEMIVRLKKDKYNLSRFLIDESNEYDVYAANHCECVYCSARRNNDSQKNNDTYTLKLHSYIVKHNKDDLINYLEKDKCFLIPLNNKNRICLSSPECIVDFCKHFLHMDELAEEYVYLIAFSNKHQPIAFFELSHGTHRISIVNPREVFVRLCLCGASNFAIVHNHPSMIVKPSTEDIDLTTRLNNAAVIIGIQMLDHIILGDSYYSMHEHGYLSNKEGGNVT